MHPQIAIPLTIKTRNSGTFANVGDDDGDWLGELDTDVGGDDGDWLGELDTDGKFDDRADKVGDCVGSFVGKSDGSTDKVGKADCFRRWLR